jgi:hypothetical protein
MDTQVFKSGDRVRLVRSQCPEIDADYGIFDGMVGTVVGVGYDALNGYRYTVASDGLDFDVPEIHAAELGLFAGENRTAENS